MCLILVFKAVQMYRSSSQQIATNSMRGPRAKPTGGPTGADILGGRDLQAGGTWLGVHRGGFAAVTNYRDADATSAVIDHVAIW